MLLHITLAALVACASSVSAQKLSVAVYYESLCPDSRNFITRQLTPTHNQLSDYFEVDWVPYGKASHSHNPWTITCQHGPSECYGNMLQSCVLARTPDKVQQVAFVNCIMTAFDPAATQECAESIGLSYDGIEECAAGMEAHLLMDVHGNRTHNFQPPITFVPTIALRDEYDQAIQDASLTRFKTVICNALPDPKPEPCSAVKRKPLRPIF